MGPNAQADMVVVRGEVESLSRRGGKEDELPAVVVVVVSGYDLVWSKCSNVNVNGS